MLLVFQIFASAEAESQAGVPGAVWSILEESRLSRQFFSIKNRLQVLADRLPKIAYRFSRKLLV